MQNKNTEMLGHLVIIFNFNDSLLTTHHSDHALDRCGGYWEVNVQFSLFDFFLQAYVH